MLNNITDKYFIIFRNTSTYPINFERLNQSSGFMIYETKISDHRQTDPVLLSVPGLRDRGYIFLDYHPKGILSRFCNINISYIHLT